MKVLLWIVGIVVVICGITWLETSPKDKEIISTYIKAKFHGGKVIK